MYICRKYWLLTIIIWSFVAEYPFNNLQINDPNYKENIARHMEIL